MYGVGIEEFVGLNVLIQIVDSNEYKKAKGENKSIFAKISHNEYNDVLLDKKYLILIWAGFLGVCLALGGKG